MAACLKLVPALTSLNVARACVLGKRVAAWSGACRMLGERAFTNAGAAWWCVACGGMQSTSLVRRAVLRWLQV